MRGALLEALTSALEQRRAVAVVTLLDDPGKQLLIAHGADSDGADPDGAGPDGAGPDGAGPSPRVLGSLGDEALDRAAAGRVAEQWLSMSPVRTTLEGREVFIDVVAPPPKLVIVGAVHVAIVLVRMAKEVGFECWVVDPRTAFATGERFAHADALIHDWPDEALEKIGVDANTFVVLLSHDLKLDVPALKVALPRARYIGALGSRSTHQKRLARLREAGVDEALYDRMHNPVGLNLGGRRAEEMAVSILAQIVAVNHGRDARPLPG